MYKLDMIVKDEHIDFQGIMDGLYYPFYMEDCRHKYIKDELGVDIVEYAKNGLNLVLAEYNFKFKAPLKKNDKLAVTCKVVPVEGSSSKFGFEQTIVCNDKVAAEARFIATCVPAAGGRPFVPEDVAKYLAVNNNG